MPKFRLRDVMEDQVSHGMSKKDAINTVMCDKDAINQCCKSGTRTGFENFDLIFRVKGIFYLEVIKIFIDYIPVHILIESLEINFSFWPCEWSNLENDSDFRIRILYNIMPVEKPARYRKSSEFSRLCSFRYR